MKMQDIVHLLLIALVSERGKIGMLITTLM